MTQEMEQLVRDNQGRYYQMKGIYDDKSNFLLVKLQYQNQEVGRTQCVLEHPPGEMKISDLIIFDDVVHTPRFFGYGWWQKVFKAKPENYRNKGLGTHLLRFVIDFAHLKGVKHVYGILTKNDMNTTPGLANWYRKHGFQLILSAPEDPPTTVYRISRWL